MKWYETHDNLVGLANWLNSECGYFSDASAAIYFFEKPWKWEREWGIWQAWQSAPVMSPPKMREFKERCIEAVDDEKMNATDLLAELEDEERDEADYNDGLAKQQEGP